MWRLLTVSLLLFLSLQLFSATASADYTPTYNTNAFANRTCEFFSSPPESCRYDTYQHPQSGTQYSYAYCTSGDYIYQSGTHDFLYNGETYGTPAYQCSTTPLEPSCESPTYADESNNCVYPPDVCWDDVVTGEKVCEWVSPDDPSAQCVMSEGVELCLGDDIPDCILANGVLQCDQPDAICGPKNGTFQCVKPQEEGCGFFNGEKVCFDPTGKPVPGESPDHPDNGGNLDGDETNDVFDSRDPTTEGGDPDNQVNTPIEPTLDSDRATEKTSRDQLLELKKLNESIKELGKGEGPTGTEASDKIDAARAGLISDTGIDGLTSGIGTNPFGSGDLGTVPGIVDNFVPQGACLAYSQNVLGFGVFEITCADTELLRTILAWIFYVFTAIYLFQLLTTPVRS